MRILLLFIILSCFTFTREATAQVVKSFKVENATLEECIKQIEKTTNLGFLYNGDELKQVSGITYEATQIDIKNLLTDLLKNTGFVYEIDKGVILIKKVGKPGAAQEKDIYTFVVKGTVIDKSKKGLPGVTVLVLGTHTGVSTDANGKYTLTYKGAAPFIVSFTFIGMKPVEIPYDGRNVINVEMEDDTEVLDDVVVTGIFTKAKESYTGATTYITEKQLKQFGNQNLLKTIRNIDPSFRILDDNLAGSNPNRMPEIKVRGTSSLPTDINLSSNLDNTKAAYSVNPNQPLVILDGFEVSFERINDLDQNRVESITILKDASATAIYGSRGANGVLVVTTKQPKNGGLTISYLGDISFEMPDLSDYNVLNATDKLKLEKAAGLFDGEDPTSNYQAYQELYNKRLASVASGVNTYWLAKPLRVGVGTKHSISLDGGDNTMRYGASIGANLINGIMEGSKRETYNGNLYLSYKKGKFTFRDDLSISFNNSAESPHGSFRNFVNTDPYYASKDANGRTIKVLDQIGTDVLGDKSLNMRTNPLYDASIGTRYESKYTYFSNFFATDYTILDGLTARARVGFIRKIGRSDDYRPGDHTDFAGYVKEEDLARRGTYEIYNNEENSVQADLTINYNRVFQEKHSLTLGLNGSINQSKNEEIGMKAEGYYDKTMDYISMGAGYAKDRKPSGIESTTRSVGIVFNANYMYDNRYFADISGRVDGSSQFGANSRFAPFWSAGLGWLIHNEAFLRETPFINYLKLRLSYGITGAQNFSPYQALTTYTYSENGPYRNMMPATMLGLGNDELSWQQTNQTNLGVEVKFWENRIGITADVYYKKTDDLLSDVTLPPSNGFTMYKENVGQIENKGFEIGVNAYVFNRDDLSWLIAGSILYNKDKILKISDALTALNNKLLAAEDQFENYSSPSFLFKEGESTNTIYVVESKGIDPSNGKEIFVKKDGSLTYEWDIKDKVAFGSSQPKFWGNINTSFRYKQITFNAVFGYQFGGNVFNQTLIDRVENVDPWMGNTDRRVLEDRWQKPGDQTFFKDIKDKTFTRASSRFVQKERTLECQALSLNYDWSTPFSKRIFRVENIRLSAYMENAFRISSVKQERGLDYPFARNLSFSVSALF